MTKKKKNRGAAQEPTDTTPGEEIKRLREQNGRVMTRLDELLSELKEMKKKSSPPETSAETKAKEAAAAKAKEEAKAKAEAAAAAKAKEQENAKEQKAKDEKKKAGDSLDAEWEVASRHKKKPPPPAASIFGVTARPPAPNESGEETRAREAREEARAAREADRQRPEGLDPAEWNVPLREAVRGDNRMKVGIRGACHASTHSEVSALMHDLQSSQVPPAMLTADKIEGATLAPVSWWKAGQKTIRRLWLTQLGTS